MADGVQVELPEMREEVRSALRSLSDPVHQATRWGRYEQGVNHYDDLNLNVHILYDDCEVLPDPDRSVGSLLLAREVPALRALDEVLGPMLDDLGDRTDGDYLSDPRWPAVVDAARVALGVMAESG